MCSEDLTESLVEKMGSCMVVFNLDSSFSVNMEAEALCAVGRDAFCNVDGKVVLLDCVYDLDLFSALRKDVAGVSDLTTHLRIERSALEHELVHGLVLCLYGTVACELYSLEFCVVVSEELDVVAVRELNPVA